MKILLLAPRPPAPEYDGATVATMRAVRGLINAGAEVTLLSMRTEKQLTESHPAVVKPPPYLSGYSEVTVKTKIKLLPLITNLIFSNKPYDLVRFHSEAYLHAIESILKREEFDLIQCEGLVMTTYLDEIRKLTRVPVVLRAHNLEHRIREMMAAGASSPLQRYYLGNLARRLMKWETRAAEQYDALLPISDSDSRWFSSQAAGRPLFLYETGAEEARYHHEAGTDQPTIGFLGPLTWLPNLEGVEWFTSRVWPLVLDKIPQATLYLAGRRAGKERKDIYSGKNIIYAGTPENSVSFIASCNIMIAPILTGSGLRIKILEAMSTGRPVVATNTAAQGLAVEEGRELFITDDPGTFSDAIITLLTNPGLRHDMGQAGVSLVKERYNNNRNSSRLMEFYKNLRDGC